ncbi:MAG: type II and III secretion system protein [Gammaproteobacteria bacterium CG22_combo_CG10-13_8_21_14_all_40_8]|nr:MAG: type II and III secretion system protein [Gammaproteobacteria bacterium CG22_combo_CG10-13_8_21_14_all_40_8]
MKGRVKSAILIFLSLFCFNANATEKEKIIRLHVGSVKSLDVGKVLRVAVGIDTILGSSILDNGELLLIPKAAGETDLKIWKKGERINTYKVIITASDTKRQIETLSSVLRSFHKVNVRDVNGILILEGKISPDHFENFQGIVAQFPGVINMVSPEDVLMKDMINFKVQVLEVNKSYAKKLGISWDRSTAGPSIGYVQNFHANGRYVVTNPDSPFGQGLFDADNPIIGFNDSSSHSFFGIASSLSSRINLLKEDGAARTLAEPNLSTRSGEEANFHSGGEYPLAVLNEFGQPVVQMQDYGIQLSIKPISDEYGNIVSTVRAEMSNIDFSVVVNGVPGLLTRNTESVVNLKSGETMIISGLLQSSDSKNVEKMPIMGDIPILGELFKSKNFVENRSELIILVTPTIVTPDKALPETLSKHLKSLHKVLSQSKIEDELLD